MLHPTTHQISYSQNVHFDETDFFTSSTAHAPADFDDLDDLVPLPTGGTPYSEAEPDTIESETNVPLPAPSAQLPETPAPPSSASDEAPNHVQENLPRRSLRNRPPIKDWSEPPLGYNPDYVPVAQVPQTLS